MGRRKWLETLPYLDPSDPKPGYYVLVGQVQNIENPIFSISQEDSNLAIARVGLPMSSTSWYYDSLTDRLLYKPVETSGTFPIDLRQATGLTELGTGSAVGLTSLDKSSISARIDEVE